jgi:hypothetical protein
VADQIAELSARAAAARERGDALRRELALAERQLAAAEAQRDERLRKSTNLLSVMNETAVFVLTSFECQARDLSKDDIAAHSGALSAIIREMANIGQELTGIQPPAMQKPVVSKSVQTVLPVKKFITSGNSAAKPTVAKVSEFRRASEYQRVFVKGAGGPPGSPPGRLRLGRASS